jgi:predicted nucleic acid-binding protein
MSEALVVDASAIVDLLLGNELGAAVRRRVAGTVLHAPAHLEPPP